MFDALRRLFGRPSGQDGADTSAADASAGEMISCDEAAARLFEFLDGELESASEDEVRRHLDVCERCYPRVQFEKHFLEGVGPITNQWSCLRRSEKPCSPGARRGGRLQGVT